MPHTDQKARQVWYKSWRERRRLELIEMLGGKCTVCGSTENLQFHHLNPNEKVNNVTRLLHSPDHIRFAEIKKCELRCEKHHKQAHEAKHGSFGAYQNGCRCEECVTGKRAYNADWMARWRAAGKDKSRRNFKGHAEDRS